MLKRGLGFCLVLTVASVARAGAVVSLVPTLKAPDGTPISNAVYTAGTNTVCYEVNTASDDIDIKATSTAGGDRELRHLQLDFSQSTLCPGGTTCATALFLSPPTTHTGSNVRIFDFKGEPQCSAGTETTCGAGHYFDASFTAPIGRETVVSSTYYFVTSDDLNGDPGYQKTLKGTGETTLAHVRVLLPTTIGMYTLNALNSAQTNPDLGGADIRFGFGTDVTGGDGIALTTWRANLASPNNITGSPLTIQIAAAGGCVGVTGACCVGGNNCVLGQTQAQCASASGQYQGDGSTSCTNCPPPPCTIHLTSSSPADQGSLWRTERNIFYLTFDAAVALPPAGALKIEKITGGATPACTFAADMATGFTNTLTNAVPPAAPGGANTVLQVRENAVASPGSGPLEHRTWIRVSYTGTNWTGVCPFSREFVVQVGDADANKFVTAADVGSVNASPTGVAAINSRFDIDGNGFRTAADVGLANASIGGLPAKPCDPPAVP